MRHTKRCAHKPKCINFVPSNPNRDYCYTHIKQRVLACKKLNYPDLYYYASKREDKNDPIVPLECFPLDYDK